MGGTSLQYYACPVHNDSHRAPQKEILQQQQQQQQHLTCMPPVPPERPVLMRPHVAVRQPGRPGGAPQTDEPHRAAWAAAAALAAAAAAAAAAQS
eukprot:1150455-Pelagomonas_calceolata.AAC.2